MFPYFLVKRMYAQNLAADRGTEVTDNHDVLLVLNPLTQSVSVQLMAGCCFSN